MPLTEIETTCKSKVKCNGDKRAHLTPPRSEVVNGLLHDHHVHLGAAHSVLAVLVATLLAIFCVLYREERRVWLGGGEALVVRGDVGKILHERVKPRTKAHGQSAGRTYVQVVLGLHVVKGRQDRCTPKF